MKMELLPPRWSRPLVLQILALACLATWNGAFSPVPAEALRYNAAQGRKADCGFADMDPCYLPDGRIVFVSTPSMRNVFCAGSTVTTLYVMDADGKNMRCLSAGPINELSPSVLRDGRVLYTRWEYVDKGQDPGAVLPV